MKDIRQRFYRTKVTFLAFALTVAGLALVLVDAWAISSGHLSIARPWPVKDIGLALFTTGLIAVAFTYIDGQDKEGRDTERIGRAVEAQAPAIVQAVLDGLVASPTNLELLGYDEQDQLIRNGLAARLGDATFAAEVYDDIRDQAVRAAERWHDLRVEIRLSPQGMPIGSVKGAPAATTPGEMYAVTVRCDYKVIPRHLVRHFVCVSDRAEYRELSTDGGATSAWFLKPKPGVDPSAREAFELLQFTVDGRELDIRRSTRKGGQTYTVALASAAATAPDEVTVAYTHRTVTAVDGHLLHFAIEQPTDGISIELDYTETGINAVSVVDFIASSREARLIQSSAEALIRTVRVEFDGWVFPRSGTAFIWKE